LQRERRRLAAIVAADIAGYSRLVSGDEEGALRALRSHRRDLIDPMVEDYGGRIANTAGDSLLLEFSSAVDAVRFAQAMQRNMDERNSDLAADRRMLFRIGINVGDVVAQDGDLLGDGVNVAARLEGLAAPGGICISRSARDQVRDRLDLELDDLGEIEVKNIARPIRAFTIIGNKAEASQPETEIEPGTRKPALAILPFDNIGGNPEQEYFADGVTEDLITALSRYYAFSVIARNSSFTFKGQATDVRDVGKALGARYVVEGSVRKAGERVRITAQLIDAESGEHIWAKRYDRVLRDIFELQDEITETIANAISPAIEASEHKAALGKHPSNLDAWDHCLRGIWHFYRYTEADKDAGRRELEAAIALDPNFSLVHTRMALSHMSEAKMNWTDDPKAAVDAAYGHARRAVQIDDRDALAHGTFAIANSWRGRHDIALEEAARGVALNSTEPQYVYCQAICMVYAGKYESSIPVSEKCLALNADDPLNFLFHEALALAHFALGNLDGAEQAARNSLNIRRGFVFMRALLVAILAAREDSEAADIELQNVKQHLPEFSTDSFTHMPFQSDLMDMIKTSLNRTALGKTG
jgi:adenylate cyclase